MSSSGTFSPRYADPASVSSPQQSISARLGTRAAVALVLVCAVVAGFAQVPGRDTWMDEVWSMFLSDPSIPIGSLIFDRWAYDIHPPLFMLLARAYRSLVADQIVAARLLNLLVLIPALAYVVSVWRRAPSSRFVIAMFTPIFCGGMFFVHYPAEFRVYFMLILVSAVYALASWRAVPAALRGTAISAIDLAALMVSAFLLMSLHVLAVPFVLGHAGLIALLMLKGGRRDALLALRGYWLVLAMALLSLAGFYLFIENFEQGTTAGGSWIRELSLPKAVLRVSKWLFMMAPGVVALAIIANGFMRRSGAIADDEARADPAERVWLATTLLAIIGFVALVLVANLRTPLMVDRYFAVLSGPLALLLAVMASRVAAGWSVSLQRLVLAAAVLNGLVAIGAQYRIEKSYWNEGLYYSDSLLEAKALNARCDAPILHATDNRLRYATYQEQLGDWVSRYLAPSTGTRLQAAGRDTPIRATSQCPVALWIPFISRGGEGTIEAVIAEHKLVLDGLSIDQLRLDLRGSSAIVRLKP